MVVVCSMDCKNKSKYPIRKYKGPAGKKLYGCKLDVVSIMRISDPDDYVRKVVEEKCMAHCINYEPLNPTSEEEKCE